MSSSPTKSSFRELREQYAGQSQRQSSDLSASADPTVPSFDFPGRMRGRDGETSPKSWTPKQVGEYVRRRYDADDQEEGVDNVEADVERLVKWVNENQIGGRAFLRMASSSAAGKGTGSGSGRQNEVIERKLREASRTLRQSSLRGRIWGFGNGNAHTEEPSTYIRPRSDSESSQSSSTSETQDPLSISQYNNRMRTQSDVVAFNSTGRGGEYYDKPVRRRAGVGRSGHVRGMVASFERSSSEDDGDADGDADADGTGREGRDGRRSVSPTKPTMQRALPRRGRVGDLFGPFDSQPMSGSEPLSVLPPVLPPPPLSGSVRDAGVVQDGTVGGVEDDVHSTVKARGGGEHRQGQYGHEQQFGLHGEHGHQQQFGQRRQQQQFGQHGQQQQQQQQQELQRMWGLNFQRSGDEREDVSQGRPLGQQQFSQFSAPLQPHVQSDSQSQSQSHVPSHVQPHVQPPARWIEPQKSGPVSSGSRLLPVPPTFTGPPRVFDVFDGPGAVGGGGFGGVGVETFGFGGPDAVVRGGTAFGNDAEFGVIGKRSASCSPNKGRGAGIGLEGNGSGGRNGNGSGGGSAPRMLPLPPVPLFHPVPRRGVEGVLGLGGDADVDADAGDGVAVEDPVFTHPEPAAEVLDAGGVKREEEEMSIEELIRREEMCQAGAGAHQFEGENGAKGVKGAKAWEMDVGLGDTVKKVGSGGGGGRKKKSWEVVDSTALVSLDADPVSVSDVDTPEGVGEARSDVGADASPASDASFVNVGRRDRDRERKRSSGQSQGRPSGPRSRAPSPSPPPPPLVTLPRVSVGGVGERSADVEVNVEANANANVNAEVAERWREVGRREEQVARRERDVDVREGVVAADQDVVVREKEGLGLREGVLRGRQGQLEQREKAVLGREDDLAVREARLVGREAELGDREKEVVEREAGVVDREAGLERRRVELEERERVIIGDLEKRQVEVGLREEAVRVREERIGLRERVGEDDVQVELESEQEPAVSYSLGRRLAGYLDLVGAGSLFGPGRPAPSEFQEPNAQTEVKTAKETGRRKTTRGASDVVRLGVGQQIPGYVQVLLGIGMCVVLVRVLLGRRGGAVGVGVGVAALGGVAVRGVRGAGGALAR
ncbi:hypothetical protein FA15DRAFT_650463, partial [Coprinopsis marcescibilis]